jgi:hypothetical protein
MYKLGLVLQFWASAAHPLQLLLLLLVQERSSHSMPNASALDASGRLSHSGSTSERGKGLIRLAGSGNRGTKAGTRSEEPLVEEWDPNKEVEATGLGEGRVHVFQHEALKLCSMLTTWQGIGSAADPNGSIAALCVTISYPDRKGV